MASRYDLHFQILAAGQVSGERVFGFGYVSAVAVRGPQKLINRWLKCLMTPQGSDPFDSKYGTGFANLIGANLSDAADLIDAVTLFIQDCNAQIRLFESKTQLPANERLQTATLSQVVERDAAGYDLYVSISNVAGEKLLIELPPTSVR